MRIVEDTSYHNIPLGTVVVIEESVHTELLGLRQSYYYHSEKNYHSSFLVEIDAEPVTPMDPRTRLLYEALMT